MFPIKAYLVANKILYVLLIFPATVFADTCYKTLGTYIYSSYCSGSCSGSYGSETCNYSYYYTYYYYYYSDVVDALGAGAIAGIVIGCLIAAAVVIGIIVCIIKSVNRSSASPGTLVQPSGTATVAYTTQMGSANYNYGASGYPGQQPAGQQGYPPQSTGYPPMPNEPQYPPPYTTQGQGGLTPVDTKNVYI